MFHHRPTYNRILSAERAPEGVLSADTNQKDQENRIYSSSNCQIHQERLLMRHSATREVPARSKVRSRRRNQLGA